MSVGFESCRLKNSQAMKQVAGCNAAPCCWRFCKSSASHWSDFGMMRPSVMMLCGLSKRISICWKVTSTQDRRQASSHNISESNEYDDGFGRIHHGFRGQDEITPIENATHL